MPTKLALSTSRTIAANGNGYAVISFGPTAAGESWVINRITVQNTGASTPRANVYRGGAALPTRFLEGTSAGNSDVSDTAITLMPLDQITVDWSGCIPGSMCIVVVEGDQILPGKRAY